MIPSPRRSRLPFANRLALLAAVLILGVQLPIADTVLAAASGTFSAKLTGSHQAPAVPTSATGSARVILNGSTIYYQLFFDGLGPIVGAEIALGPIGQSGPVAFTLAVADGSVSGQLTATDLAPSAGVSFDAALDAIA